MKRFIIYILIVFCMISCTSTYSYTSTSTYDDCYRISYKYEYYIDGIAYPVVYVNSIPYYYIGGYWYNIPVYRYSFIRVLRYPCYRYVNHYPRYRCHTHYYHEHHPVRKYNHYKINNRPSKPNVRHGGNNSHRRPSGIHTPQHGGNIGGHRR